MARVDYIGRDAGTDKLQDCKEHEPGFELPPPKEWMTLSEASARYGRSVDELKQAIREGRLRATTGPVRRLHLGDLKAFMFS